MTTPVRDIGRKPPVAPGLPLVGNAVDLLRDPLACFVRLYERMGPVFRVVAPGRSYVVLAGPEANRSFLSWDERFLSSQPVYAPYVKDLGSRRVLIAMDGEEHQAYRKWLRPGLSREAIGPHVPRMLAVLDDSVSKWQVGEVLDVTKVLQYLIAQMSGVALAGRPVDGDFEAVRTFAHTFLGAGVGSFPGFLRLSPRYRRARRRFFRFVRNVISQHRRDGIRDRPADLIDLLLQGSSPSGEPLSEADILASAHMPYSNSLVYVSATCGFLLYELLRHPDVLTKVQDEVDELFSGGPVRLQELQQTRWLRGALLETQRLHPIALSLPRYAHTPFEFEGHRIEAGEMTLTATAVTQFLPQFFPEPDRFDVTRYWPPRSEHRQPSMLVPYGIGPHVCLAAGVVHTLALLAVGALLHRLEFDLEPSDYRLGVSVAPFPAPARDFRLRVRRRREPRAASGRGVEGAPAAIEDLFSELDPHALARAAEKASKEAFGPGTWILREGGAADRFYILTSGEVEVLKGPLDDGPKVLARIGAPGFFGEIGLLHGVPRTASVRATDACEAIVLDRRTFLDLVADTDMTSAEIAALVHRRWVAATLAGALPRLPPDAVRELAPRFTRERHHPGSVIVRQGDAPDRFYLIARGEVEVINTHPDGREIPLGRLRAGDFFGEIGLLQDRPRTATVRAVGEVEVMALEREDFLVMVSDSEATGEQIALKVAERLAERIKDRPGSDGDREP